MEPEKKVVTFKYLELDGSIDLGVPKSITVENGNCRDGGCNFKFHTSELSIGFDEKFSLYLFAEGINDLTEKIWEKYYETEPARSKMDLEKHIQFLKGLVGE